jgi:hypothetical protein
LDEASETLSGRIGAASGFLGFAVAYPGRPRQLLGETREVAKGVNEHNLEVCYNPSLRI